MIFQEQKNCIWNKSYQLFSCITSINRSNTESQNSGHKDNTIDIEKTKISTNTMTLNISAVPKAALKKYRKSAYHTKTQKNAPNVSRRCDPHMTKHWPIRIELNNEEWIYTPKISLTSHTPLHIYKSEVVWLFYYQFLIKINIASSFPVTGFGKLVPFELLSTFL